MSKKDYPLLSEHDTRLYTAVKAGTCKCGVGEPHDYEQGAQLRRAQGKDQPLVLDTHIQKPSRADGRTTIDGSL